MIASRGTLSKTEDERLQQAVGMSLNLFTQSNLGIDALLQLLQRCQGQQRMLSSPGILREQSLRPSASVLMAGEGYRANAPYVPVSNTLLDPPRALSK